jgi:hypothetical protein
MQIEHVRVGPWSRTHHHRIQLRIVGHWKRCGNNTWKGIDVYVSTVDKSMSLGDKHD